jgi:predicted DNA-binding protein (MmcQ/YjbR family)
MAARKVNGVNTATVESVLEQVIAIALDYPEAWEDHPWGEMVAKVGKKIFMFASIDDGTVSITVKLPETGDFARTMGEVSPTGYGLGKSGWITARFGDPNAIDLDLIRDWIDESYCAIAPKRLIALLAQGDQDI